MNNQFMHGANVLLTPAVGIKAKAKKLSVNAEYVDAIQHPCVHSPQTFAWRATKELNLLKPTGHVMHQQFNIQQLYVLPTLYLCVLNLSENKQQLVPLTA